MLHIWLSEAKNLVISSLIKVRIDRCHFGCQPFIRMNWSVCSDEGVMLDALLCWSELFNHSGPKPNVTLKDSTHG